MKLGFNYSNCSEQEKRIYDQVYALSYAKFHNAYEAITDAEKSIYDLRREQKNGR